MTAGPLNELHSYFQKRVQCHELLARHAAFGAGGPADVWISLAGKLGIQLHHEEPQQMRKTLARHKHDRQLTEPKQRHADSIFKDPPGHQASRLIDQAGMKGKVHSRAQIAERNPNYLVNLGGARAADVAALMVEAHQAVLAQCDMDLELDVEMHGAWKRRT